MIPINPKTIDDIHIQKFMSSEKMLKVLSFVKEQSSKKLIKTASVDHNTLISLFTQMLSCLNLKADNVKEAFSNLSSDESLNKMAKKVNSEKHDEIRIVSKHIKDSHYQIDISKDLITKDNKKIFMVSCYARDAYLGRYLIKRNYFYTSERESSADNAYDEILTKMAALKERYYNEVIDVAAIFAQMKKTLDGVISEIKTEEDVGTNISR